jgi:hypothetical protein
VFSSGRKNADKVIQIRGNPEATLRGQEATFRCTAGVQKEKMCRAWPEESQTTDTPIRNRQTQPHATNRKNANPRMHRPYAVLPANMIHPLALYAYSFGSWQINVYNTASIQKSLIVGSILAKEAA